MLFAGGTKKAGSLFFFKRLGAATWILDGLARDLTDVEAALEQLPWPLPLLDEAAMLGIRG